MGFWTMIEVRVFGLAACWALTLSTTILLTDVGPLSAIGIGVEEGFASLTISFFFFGAAVSSIQSIKLFDSIGRYWGFTIGCMSQFLGCICGMIGMLSKNSIVLFLGCFSVGYSQGLGQFYRFAVFDLQINGSSKHNSGKDVTTVLSGGLIAAIIGPTLAAWSRDMFETEYVGSYLMIGLIAICNQMTLSLIPFSSTLDKSECNHLLPPLPPRPIWEIISQSRFVIACGTATLANAAMVMIMSQFSVDMDRHNFEFGYISLVLELHLLSMYVPSFFSGFLLDLVSPPHLTLFGNSLFLLGLIFLGYVLELPIAYLFGMILVGIAWNFSFSSATVLLCDCYQPSESYLVQGLNDTLLMIVSGVGSVVSGLILASYGWIHLLLFVGLLILFSTLMLLGSKSSPRSQPFAGCGPSNLKSFGQSYGSVDTYLDSESVE